MNSPAPIVFVDGGNFAKKHELPVEAVLSFAFLFGSGGPKRKRATAIMTADVVLVLHQLFSCQISFETNYDLKEFITLGTILDKCLTNLL